MKDARDWENEQRCRMDKHLYSAAGPIPTKVDEGEINEIIFTCLELHVQACIRTQTHTLHVSRLRMETHTLVLM